MSPQNRVGCFDSFPDQPSPGQGVPQQFGGRSVAGGQFGFVVVRVVVVGGVGSAVVVGGVGSLCGATDCGGGSSCVAVDGGLSGVGVGVGAGVGSGVPAPVLGVRFGLCWVGVSVCVRTWWVRGWREGSSATVVGWVEVGAVVVLVPVDVVATTGTAALPWSRLALWPLSPWSVPAPVVVASAAAVVVAPAGSVSAARSAVVAGGSVSPWPM